MSEKTLEYHELSEYQKALVYEMMIHDNEIRVEPYTDPEDYYQTVTEYFTEEE